MTDTGRGIRVLHVDDDPSFLEVVATYLENEDGDLTVLTEDSAADGIDRIHAEAVDCVVSDYRMPAVDGMDLLSAIRETEDVPFVMFTNKGSTELERRVAELDRTAYLDKGVGADRYELLAETIRSVVADHGKGD